MGKFNWGMRACGILLLWAGAAIAMPAKTFQTLHNFDGPDGVEPDGGLVQGTNGNLFGTTFIGGAYGEGTVFKISPAGKLTTIYSFCASGSACPDGTGPAGTLVQANNGDFYGTTVGGGANALGTIFKITGSGTLTTVHSFDGTDGEAPYAGLIQSVDGRLYGTTVSGGANGDGTVFVITARGTLTTLHSFAGTDGQFPYAALLEASSTNFFGITSGGGANGDGTVFKITGNGTLTTLHSFDGNDGGAPYAALVQVGNGTLFGATTQGGVNSDGTVFKITLGGKLTTLHNFDQTNGYEAKTLILGSDGNFYGTAAMGGANSDGTIFMITPTGTLTTLHSFSGTDGTAPFPLTQDTNGSFYGNATAGGTNGDGTIFTLSVGLRPFVETQPTSGTVGTAVTILGTGLGHATNVRFNGIEAKFTVVSGSAITTTVPKGATTGPVRVITPSGKLQSNVPFRVRP